MTTSTVKPTAALEKKDVQKLQRAIIDGLEDVKGQDIAVFDTEHITSLFERVIIASGTSNRQTKALAASVRDAVRDAGFSKPRIEGEENGEWIIVDCGAAVAHIMQPTIRAYYHLEELWGDKPIKLKLGAPAPLVKAAKVTAKAAPVAAPAAAKSRAKPGARSAAKPAVKPPVRDHEPGYIGKLGKTSDWTAKRNEAAPAEEYVLPSRAPLKRAADKASGKAAPKTAARSAVKSVAKLAAKPAAKPAVKPVVKPAAKTAVVKIAEPKKVVARKVAVKTAAAKSVAIQVKSAAKTAANAAAKTATKAASPTAVKKPAARKTAPRTR